MADSGFCAARSKIFDPTTPDSYFICTNDQGHSQLAHTACDGHGHVLARWASETSPIEVWAPYAGVTMRVVIP